MIDRPKLPAVLAGAAGGAIAIGAMEFFSALASYPLMAIPFATSIVLVMGSPSRSNAAARLDRHRDHQWIDPCRLVNELSWSFLIAPVGVGALLLALFAFVWHNVVASGPNKSETWPIRWW